MRESVKLPGQDKLPGQGAQEPQEPCLAPKLRITGPGLDHLGRFQPHHLPASPLHRGKPAPIGVPHDTGITQTDDARQPP